MPTNFVLLEQKKEKQYNVVLPSACDDYLVCRKALLKKSRGGQAANTGTTKI